MNPFSVSSSLSAWSVDPTDHIDSSATLGSSEFHFRYLYFITILISLHFLKMSFLPLISIADPFSSKPSFTDIIQARDVAELCSTLVLVSEATRIVLGIYIQIKEVNTLFLLKSKSAISLSMPLSC